MKRVISILILLVLLFFVFQWGIVFFKKEHDVSYQVFVEDNIFNIHERYQKEHGDIYDIVIKNGSDTYSYIIENKYNKQKKIIKEIEYYNENDNHCIYPILENGEGTYLECSKKGKLYTGTAFPDQNFISKIKTNLSEKGYSLHPTINFDKNDRIGDSTVYTEALLPSDIITLWNYKGIEIIESNDPTVISTLNFDKYENKHSYLVGKYYVVPNYLNSKVQEFSSVTVIDLESKKSEVLELEYTLSSDTYMNGIISGKLYYTDPSNLLQMEINPAKKNSRLIGSKDIGGQLYKNGWQDTNIYDFVTTKIMFQEEISGDVTEKYSYQQIIESDANYYFYTNNGEVYRVSKNDLDMLVLLFQMQGLNNFKVIDKTVYFAVGDTLYYFEEGKGIISILKNNELRYNTINRIDIYRKS